MKRADLAFAVDKKLRGVVSTKVRIAIVLLVIVGLGVLVVVTGSQEGSDDYTASIPEGFDRSDVTWHSPGTPATDAEIARWEAARAALEELRVRGRAPQTGYDREEFGPSWTDDVDVAFGGNGCDTRNDILIRDFLEVTFRPGEEGCVVGEGTILDPFTLETIEFVRGPETSGEVQVDHLVALSDAWQKGAQQLSERERRNFANDPRNLLAVAGWANQQKSDSDASGWLPPNRSYRCTYVSQQIEVKTIYQLWVTAAERDAMLDVFDTCLD
ncbi:HNH endonuclease family protein [Lolliginicoccus levis]|uniref:HNH endonuclease family protein n=1 Tax=Lolliginicoccus levis TaxID=2919542 RepID=UPI00241DFF16|nr:HNH endonuclease family protein [Lolliginicoccus levis]